MGLPFSAIVKYVMGGFNPLSWFAKGEPGAWYDPSDFQPNWRRNLLTYSQMVSGAISGTPGTAPTGWGFTLSAGTTTATPSDITFSASTSSRHFVSQNITLTANTTYTLSINILASAGTSTDNIVLVNQNSGIVTGSNSLSVSDGVGRKTLTFTTGSAGATIGIRIGCGCTAGVLSNNTVTVSDAQLEQSSSASTYQKITDGIQDYYTVQPQPVLFQDSAGTTPVTAVEQPVGLMLDKSRGLALGAELVTNGDFSNGTTGWGLYLSTISNVNNTLRVTAIAANTTAYGTQALTGLVIGSWYALSITQIVGAGSSLIYNFVGPTAFSNTYRNSSDPSTKTTNSYFLATATTCYITVGTYGPATGNYADFDNISVKQIAGNHAFQATAGNRPVLSARTNLLTKTEDFSDAIWWVLGSVAKTNNYTYAPDGTLTAGRIVFSSNSSTHQFFQYQATTAISYTQKIWLKVPSGTGSIMFGFYDGEIKTSSIPLTTQWQQFSFSTTTVVNVGSRSIWLYPDGSAGMATEIHIWHPDLRPTNSGALLPPYQRVNTASDYDTVGFPLYLKANGTSSAMSTNSIDFTATDKMTVVTGVRKLSDVLDVAIELSVNSTVIAGNGAFLLITGRTPQKSSFSSRGTATREIYGDSAFSAPMSVVFSGLSSISTPAVYFRNNGVEKSSDFGSQGTGNFGNYPLYLFSRNQAQYFLNGQFYGAIIRGAQSDTASVTQTENYMAQKTGITF